MNESLGLIETKGLVSAISVADAMVKSANVKIIGLENTKGLGFITVKIKDDVGAVNAAVLCGKHIATESNAFVSSKVIPRPSKNIETTFCKLINTDKEINIKKKSEFSINTHEQKNSNDNKGLAGDSEKCDEKSKKEFSSIEVNSIEEGNKNLKNENIKIEKLNENSVKDEKKT
ncbi:BMC domain-containing protein, partial [Clostridium butyricum]